MNYAAGMRVLLVLAVLAAPAIGHADSFVEAVGGLSSPLGDDAWTKYADTSPKLAVRAGAVSGDVGGLVSADWTPVQLDSNGSLAGALDTTGHEFRILANVVLQHRLAPKVSISARGGAGIDIAYGSYSVALGNSTTSHSNTDLGVAFELGGGVWFDLSSSVQLGGELALPISHHSTQAQNLGDIAFDYTSYNIDLLFGVRLFSR